MRGGKGGERDGAGGGRGREEVAERTFEQEAVEGRVEASVFCKGPLVRGTPGIEECLGGGQRKAVRFAARRLAILKGTIDVADVTDADAGG